MVIGATPCCAGLPRLELSRQLMGRWQGLCAGLAVLLAALLFAVEPAQAAHGFVAQAAVSYTHLTLPTKVYV